MRIAVLVYGRLNKCADHYKNIIESLGEKNEIDFFASSDNSDEKDLNDFIRLYKPRLYNNSAVEYTYNLDKYPGKKDEMVIHNMICHFINKNCVLILLEEYINKNNIHYHCVISLRIDCVYIDKFVFDLLEDNTIYIPSGYDYYEKSVNDRIAYGKMDVMKKYNSINILELLEKNRSIPHPESLNYANLYFHKLKIIRVTLESYIDR